MARKVSFSALESRSARLRLKIRRRPYSGPSLARGISLMYRRNKTNGTWVLKASDGQTYTLSQLKGKTVVLAWFPKAFTGG